MRIHAFATGALACLVTASTLAAPAAPVIAPERVPSNPSAFLSVNDANAMWSAIEQSPLYEPIASLFANPALADDPDFQQMQLELDKASLELGYALTPGSLLGNVMKGMDIYVSQTPGADPEMLFVGRMDSADSATNLISYARNRAAEMALGNTGGDLEFEEVDVAGRMFYRAADQPTLVGTDGALLLAGTSTAILEDAFASTGIDRIESIEGYRSLMEKAGHPEGQMVFYGDMAQLAGIFAALAPQNAAQAQQLDGEYLVVGDFAPDRFDFRTFSSITPETELQERLMALPRTDFASLVSFAAPNAMITFGTNMAEGQLLYDAAIEQAELDPNMGLVMLMATQQIQQMEAQLGLSLEGDVFPAFGPNSMLAINNFMFMLGQVRLDLVTALQIRDHEKALPLIERIHNGIVEFENQQLAARNPSSAGVQVEEEEYAGALLRTIPLESVQGVSGIAHTVTSDGHFVIALSTADLKKAIDRSQDPASGLAGAGHWQRAFATSHIPADGQVVMAFDLQRTMQTLTPLATMGLGMMGAGQQEFAAANAAMQALTRAGALYYVTSSTPELQTATVSLVMSPATE